MFDGPESHFCLFFSPLLHNTATDAGLIFLDTIDFYINFVLLLTGFFETFGAGWIYGIEQTIQNLGSTIVVAYMFTNFGSIIVACCLWFGMNDPDNAVWAGFVALFLCYAVGMAVTGYLLNAKIQQQQQSQQNEWTWSSILYELCLSNVMNLKNDLQEVVGYMPWMWAFAMKYFLPQILLILFINLAQSENGEGNPLFGNYGGYVPWPFQILGILCVVFAGILVLVGIATPNVYLGFDIPAKNELLAAAAASKNEAMNDDDVDYEKNVATKTKDDNTDPEKNSNNELSSNGEEVEDEAMA